MNDPARLAQPAPGVRELEALLAVAAIVTVGPLAIVAGAVLAAVMENRRRVWLAALALPSTAGGILLRSFARRHVLAAATAIRAGHAHRDLRSVVLELWPHLLPVWLCTLTLAPLIALAILRRRGAQRLDLQGGEQQRPRSTARLERRCARRAESGARAHERALRPLSRLQARRRRPSADAPGAGRAFLSAARAPSGRRRCDRLRQDRDGAATRLLARRDKQLDDRLRRRQR